MDAIIKAVVAGILTVVIAVLNRDDGDAKQDYLDKCVKMETAESIFLQSGSMEETGLQMDHKKRKRIQWAERLVLDRLDYILETNMAPDFVEVVGCVGGDTVTYRVYDDGSVYER